jgi:DNA-binding transcriptional LysR family regulator
MLCSNNGEVLRAAAIQGLGITLLPHFIVSAAIDKRLLQIVLPAYRPSVLAVEILYPIDRHLSTKIRLLVDFLKERFGHG